MSVQAGYGKMRDVNKALVAQWSSMQSVWRDTNSRRFEEAFIEPLLLNLKSAEAAMEHMQSVLSKVRRDCG